LKNIPIFKGNVFFFYKMFNQRNDINSLFGSYNAAPDTGDIRFGNRRDKYNSMKDFVYRETGIAKEYKHIAKATNALADPEDYLTRKNQDLLAIGEQTVAIFDDTFSDYMRRGFSQKESKIRALEEAKRAKNNLMAIHLEDFPTKIRDVNIRDIKNK